MLTSVDEIKSRLDIVDLIKEYTNLKQVGVNWKALCPFHNEKTPSFIVSQDKQVWHCFGCGEGGDMFTFIEKIENVDFMEALRILAQKANVELKEFSKKDLSQRAKLLDIHEAAADFWQKKLFVEEGEKAREYLKARGFSKESVIKWKIGYAVKAWDSILNFLQSKGYTERELIVSGLVLAGENKKKPYDRFRDRIIFSIFDHNGQIIGFTGRLLEKDSQAAKYINSPQTPIYDKSSVVYGLNFAKSHIKEREQVVLVEGNTDVISSHETGVENVVAVSGTALTNQQLQLLRRYTDTIVVAFDQDSAGVKALERSIFLALNAGFTVKVALLPDGHDPDSVIKQNPAKWRKLIANSINYIDYYFQKAVTEFDLEEPQGRKKAAQVIMPILAQIPDKVEQEVYLQKLSGILQVSSAVLKQALPGRKSAAKSESKINKPVQTSTVINLDEQRHKRSEILLACLLADPYKIGQTAQTLPLDIWRPGLVKNLYSELILSYNQLSEQASKISVSKWYNEFENKLLTSEDNELVDFSKTIKMLSDDLVATDVRIDRELDMQIRYFKKEFLQKQISKLQRQLALGQENDEEILNKLNLLIQKLSQFDKQ